MPLTAHAGVEGEAVGFGHSFQPRVRSIQWTDGANHEGLAPLLRADSDPIRHGTTQKMRHGTRVVCGLQFQPGVLCILFQQTLAFQGATYTLTDQLNQILELVFIRCLDALKPRWSVVAIDVNTIQKQDVY